MSNKTHYDSFVKFFHYNRDFLSLFCDVFITYKSDKRSSVDFVLISASIFDDIMVYFACCYYSRGNYLLLLSGG